MSKTHFFNRRKGNRGLQIHRDKGILWLKASIFIQGQSGYHEFLVCQDEEKGIFKLTSSLADSIPGALMIRNQRMRRYPNGTLVKVKR